MSKDPIYNNPGAEIDQRVEDLVSRMTVDEKISQMLHYSPAVERLGLPEYDWWNECCHGVARAGKATVFPHAIGLAATFNSSLVNRVASVISDEARAKHHAAKRKGYRRQYVGLTYWTPNINIFRDPRWGRGQETFGEDPYLTARMGVEFIKGMQGDDPKYLKLVATPKHFAVHSGPENIRHSFDAQVNQRDLRETYLPAFKAAVTEAKAYSVMGAYNRTNGEPCCASPTLLQKILRDEWGFDGYVVSDCGAVCDFHLHHKITDGPAESAALAIKNGCDLNCGPTYARAIDALRKGLLTEADIDKCLARVLKARFKLGMFDPDEKVPYSKLPGDIVNCASHIELSRHAARESIVLLKNENNFLPINKEKIRSVAVVGPNSFELRSLLGNYNGHSSNLVTGLQGIINAVDPGVRVGHDDGCDKCADKPIYELSMDWLINDGNMDLVIAYVGLNPAFEGEEISPEIGDGGGDRRSIKLPGRQEELLKYLARKGKPIVLVVMGGSCVDLSWADENIPAIMMAWYPGEQGGNAIADIIFGDHNPSGRLPVTFYKSENQLPAFTDYSMAGRTYRFFKDEPVYHFGYGLSYTKFEYSDIRLTKNEISTGDSVQVSVKVTNTGDRDGDEVVQLYVSDVEASVPVPQVHLEGFKKVHLKTGESQTIAFTLRPEQFCAYDDEGKQFIEAGDFVISIGGGQPADKRSKSVSTILKIK